MVAVVDPAEATRSMATAGAAGAELDVPALGGVGPVAGGVVAGGVAGGVGVVGGVEPPGPCVEELFVPPAVVNVKS